MLWKGGWKHRREIECTIHSMEKGLPIKYWTCSLGKVKNLLVKTLNLKEGGMNVCRKEQIEEYGQCGANGQNKERGKASTSLLEILSFATGHYATSMQLIVIYNYKFGIV